MNKYRYLHFPASMQEAESLLNEYGNAGWHVVSVRWSEPQLTYYIIMERPVD